MSGNFVRERQRIVYIYNIHYICKYVYYICKQYVAARARNFYNVYYICKQYVAARARNFQTFLGRLWFYMNVLIRDSRILNDNVWTTAE